MVRTYPSLGDLIATIALIWLGALAILLIGLPIAVIVKTIEALFRLVLRY